MEEDHPSSRGSGGKQQRAEDKDLSGHYVSSGERSRGLGGQGWTQTGPGQVHGNCVHDAHFYSLPESVEHLLIKRHFVLPDFTAKGLKPRGHAAVLMLYFHCELNCWYSRR